MIGDEADKLDALLMIPWNSKTDLINVNHVLGLSLLMAGSLGYLCGEVWWKFNNCSLIESNFFNYFLLKVALKCVRTFSNIFVLLHGEPLCSFASTSVENSSAILYTICSIIMGLIAQVIIYHYILPSEQMTVCGNGWWQINKLWFFFSFCYYYLI